MPFHNLKDANLLISYPFLVVLVYKTLAFIDKLFNTVLLYAIFAASYGQDVSLLVALLEVLAYPSLR